MHEVVNKTVKGENKGTRKAIKGTRAQEEHKG